MKNAIMIGDSVYTLDKKGVIKKGKIEQFSRSGKNAVALVAFKDKKDKNFAFTMDNIAKTKLEIELKKKGLYEVDGFKLGDTAYLGTSFGVEKIKIQAFSMSDGVPYAVVKVKGTERQMLVKSLKKTKDEAEIQTLIKMVSTNSMKVVEVICAVQELEKELNKQRKLAQKIIGLKEHKKEKK